MCHFANLPGWTLGAGTVYAVLGVAPSVSMGMVCTRHSASPNTEPAISHPEKFKKTCNTSDDMGELWPLELRDRKLHEKHPLVPFAVFDKNSDEPLEWITPKPWDLENLK
jgi:hypothetical protein